MTATPTICDLLDASLAAHPDRPAVIGIDGGMGSAPRILVK